MERQRWVTKQSSTLPLLDRMLDAVVGVLEHEVEPLYA